MEQRQAEEDRQSEQNRQAEPNRLAEPGPGWRRWIVYSLRIRRVEYRIAELPLFLMPVLLTADGVAAFASLVFWEGLAAFLFLFAFGDLVNCLADRDLDAKYKPHLTEAVYGLGIRNVAIQAALSALAAVLISLHLAWLLARPWLPAMALFGVALAWAYSAPPLRLKGRGYWQLAFYWLGLFVGPMLFAASLFAWPPPASVAAFALAFGLMQTGVILINTAEDFAEDRELGVRTVIVATGLRAGVWLALVLATLGWLLLVATIVSMATEQGADAGRSLLAVGPLLAAGLYVAGSLLHLAVRLPAKEEAAVTEVKNAARFAPLWITLGAVAALWASGVLFVRG